MPRGRRHYVETTISFVVIFLLLLIGGAVVYFQSDYDRSQFGFEPVDQVEDVYSDAFDIGSFFASGLRELGGVETYKSKNLYEKINGKAPLYLDSGFVRLDFQSFVMEGDDGSFVQVYVYDMNESINAFSVYSSQKRSGVQSVEGLSQGYKTENALFFASGKFYVEMIGSKISEELSAVMLGAALKIDSQFGVEEKAVSLADMFPAENMVEGSVSLYKNDAFGYSAFKNVYVVDYEVDGEVVAAFIIQAENGENAGKLFDDYSKYLTDNGFTNRGEGVFEYDSIFEIVFVRGHYVGGVHEAYDVDIARQISDRLRVEIERH